MGIIKRLTGLLKSPVIRYIESQPTTCVRSLTDIEQGARLVEVVRDNADCDFYIAIARRFNKGNPPYWDLTGKYAQVWLPRGNHGDPKYEFFIARRDTLDEQDVANGSWYIIRNEDSPLREISDKLTQ